MRPGVLLLKGNRTYGRRKDKLLYRCILDDRSSLLVPYRLKNTSFQKHQSSKFVLVEPSTEVFQERQIGLLSNVIGDVDDLPSFYEYQLHTKGLWHPRKTPLYQQVYRQIRQRGEYEMLEEVAKMCREDRTTRDNIISVDPAGCKDIDDAFSLDPVTNTLSIYISNVPAWFYVLDLIRVPDCLLLPSTIYLPNGNREMLPSSLSEGICSLLEQEQRPALVCDVDLITGETTFTTAMIKVSKNWSYEAYEQSQDYARVLKSIRVLNEKTMLFRTVSDSHEMIAWMMVWMSHAAAQLLEKGLFRGVKAESNEAGAPGDIKTFVRGWTSTGGHYSVTVEPHDLLGLERYVHITSPIRRLPDLVNGLLLQNQLGLLSDASNFTEYWLSRCDTINVRMKSIRRLQIQCGLLHRLTETSEELDTVHTGYIIDTFEGEEDELCRYVVYLPDIKLVATYRTSEKLKRFSQHDFQLRLFQNEETFKKKIRLEKKKLE
jgi:exoribonuclease R